LTAFENVLFAKTASNATISNDCVPGDCVSGNLTDDRNQLIAYHPQINRESFTPLRTEALGYEHHGFTGNSNLCMKVLGTTDSAFSVTVTYYVLKLHRSDAFCNERNELDREDPFFCNYLRHNLARPYIQC